MDGYFAAENWYIASNSSPDYYSTVFGPGACSNGVPLGNQVPRSGDFMAGLWGSQTGSPTREYIQARLLEPLIEDSVYCVEMYVLRIETSPLAINRFGIMLSEDSLTDYSISTVLSGGILLSSPTDEFLTDTEEWMQLSWIYEAEGGEEYITLGNFWEEDELEYLSVPGTESFPLAYYHVDDVYIVECPPTSVIEENLSISIGPNPVMDILRVVSSGTQMTWRLFSLYGRLLQRGNFFQEGIISMGDLPSSLYILELTDASGAIRVERVLKN